MPQSHVSSCAILSLILLAGCTTSPGANTAATTSTTTAVTIPNLQPYIDTTGTLATYTTEGLIDESNPFFAIASTNGRTCATCHQPSQGMTITPAAATALFTSTSGADPLFATFDGANCPTVATGDTAGHSLVLNNGLIRIGVTLPTNAQFTVTVLHDPYGCATSLSSGQQTVSIYRRPLPVSGLPYISAVMWDTRETVAALDTASSFNANLTSDLTAQILNAVATHFQNGTMPTTAQMNAGLAFEQSVFTAQMTDAAAGSLSVGGANGGPANMATANYSPGINDAFGGDPSGAKFNPNVFNLYAAWNGSTNPGQASIARGERNLQHCADESHRRPRAERQCGAGQSDGAARVLRYVSRCAEPWPPLAAAADGYRLVPAYRQRDQPADSRGRRPAHRARYADLPDHRLHRRNWRACHLRDDRPRQRPLHRIVCRRKPREDSGPARTGRPGAVLPQRLGSDAHPARQFLQRTLPDGLEPHAKQDLVNFLGAL